MSEWVASSGVRVLRVKSAAPISFSSLAIRREAEGCDSPPELARGAREAAGACDAHENPQGGQATNASAKSGLIPMATW
jgi:hypothetical protein